MNSAPARKCKLCNETPGYPLYDAKCIPCWPKDLQAAAKKRSSKSAAPKAKAKAPAKAAAPKSKAKAPAKAATKAKAPAKAKTKAKAKKKA